MWEYRRQMILGSVVAVIVALSIGVGIYYYPVQPIQTSASTLTSTTTLTSVVTTTHTAAGGTQGVSISTTTVTSSLSLDYLVAHGCTVTYSEGLPLSSQINLENSSSSIFLCVKYYYYNSTSKIDLNLSNGQQLGFYAVVTQTNGLNHTISAASNFTVISSLSTIVLGGPNNENEGTTIVYSISPNGITNGSYILNIGFLASTLENCVSEYKLVIGSGTPNYYVSGSCTAPLSNQYPVNSEGFVNGFVFAEINGTA